MKGFETGILVRSKGGKMEDFGCTVLKEDHFKQVEDLLKQVETALSAVTAMSGQNSTFGGVVIKNAIAMLTEFLHTIGALMNALDPEYEIDLYCRGMVFGLHGSTMIVKFANVIIKNWKNKAGRGAKKSDSLYGEGFDIALEGIREHVKDKLFEGA